MIWTASQRRALILLICVFVLVLFVRVLLNCQYVSDAPDAPAPRAAELADRADPNSADWETLAAIPMLGQNRAREIVAYRERFALAHPGNPIAFRSSADLLHIRGIGASMVANLEPFLIFPNAARPTTTP